MAKIRTSDIYENTGELKKLEEELRAVLKASEKLNDLRSDEIKNAEELEKTVKKLNATTSDQREGLEATSAQTAEIKRRFDKFNDSLNENQIKIAALKEAQRRLNQINKLEAKLLSEKEGSYNKLSAQYSLNKLALNQMSKAQRANTKAGQDLVKNTNAIYQEMKVLQEETGKHVLSVGDYGKALEGVNNPISDFVSGLKNIIKNPIAGAVALGAAATAALGKAFSKTERGAKLMSKAQAVWNGLLDEGVKYVSDMSEKASKMWNDPAKSLQDFASNYRDAFENRVKASIDLATASGQRLAAAITGDAEAAEDAARRMSDSFAKMVSGLDDVGIALRRANFAEAWKRIQEDVALDAIARDVKKLNRELTRSAEINATAEALADQRATDSTLSLKEQLNAVDELIEAGEKRASLELQVARNNLSLTQRQIALDKTRKKSNSELLDKELSQFEQVKAAERELLLFRADAGQKRREIARDLFERELDFAVDLYDSNKLVLERQANDKKREISERAETLGRLIDLDKSAFAEQIKLTEDFTGQRVDLNELALIEDERIVRERLRQYDIDDVASGRILEILRDRKAATQDIYEIERELSELRRQTVGGVASGGVKELERQIELRDKLALSATKRNTQSSDGEPQDIFDLFGFNISDEKKAGIVSTTQLIKNQLSELTSARIQAADAAVQAADKQVAASQRQLQIEIQNRNAGYANNVETQQRELNFAKANQAKALKEQQRAQRLQIAAQSIEQGSNLVTASSKIWATLGFPAAIPAIGLMFGLFAASKIKAIQATKKQFGDGGLEIIGGGSHASGNDTYLGFQSEGKPAYGERGEAHIIIPTNKTRKYKSVLPGIVDSLRKGTFEDRFVRINAVQRNDAGVNVSASLDTSNMENELSAMRRNTERTHYINTRGQLVERYKNRTRTYV